MDQAFKRYSKEGFPLQRLDAARGFGEKTKGEKRETFLGVASMSILSRHPSTKPAKILGKHRSAFEKNDA